MFYTLLRGFQPITLTFHSPLSPSFVAKSVAMSSQTSEPAGNHSPTNSFKQQATRKTPPQQKLGWGFSHFRWISFGSPKDSPRTPVPRPRGFSPSWSYPGYADKSPLSPSTSGPHCRPKRPRPLRRSTSQSCATDYQAATIVFPESR